SQPTTVSRLVRESAASGCPGEPAWRLSHSNLGAPGSVDADRPARVVGLGQDAVREDGLLVGRVQLDLPVALAVPDLRPVELPLRALREDLPEDGPEVGHRVPEEPGGDARADLDVDLAHREGGEAERAEALAEDRHDACLEDVAPALDAPPQ